MRRLEEELEREREALKKEKGEKETIKATLEATIKDHEEAVAKMNVNAVDVNALKAEINTKNSTLQLVVAEKSGVYKVPYSSLLGRISRCEEGKGLSWLLRRI